MRQRRSRIQDETRSQIELPLEFTSQTGSVRRAAQIYCTGPFEMTFHAEWISLNDGCQRSSGIQDETRSQKKLPLEITFQTGSVRRAAQIYCAGPFERTFHSECISLYGGLKGAQRSSGIQDETRYQSKLPLEITFQTGAERRAAQIHCVGPFEMALHSEWIPQNWDREVEMTSTRNGLPFGMAAEQPPKAPLAHPPRTLEAQRPLYPMCPFSQLQRGRWPSNSQGGGR